MEAFIKTQKAMRVLEKDIEEGVKQGYIFEGAKGVGKKTAARYFAKAALCTGEKKPCGSCHSCEIYEAGTHPDLYIEENTPVKIENIRNINDELFVRPIISDRKVFIIENADDMNIAAQNAFLKSFEEPPAYAVVILIASSSQNLLPTVRSRGTRVAFSPFEEREVANFVEEKYNAAPMLARFAARYSEGLVGRAKDIMESEDFFAKRAEMTDAIAALSHDKTSIFPVIDAFGAKTRKMPLDADLCFDIFTGFFRDVAALKSGGTVINTDMEEKIGEFARRVRGSSARRIIDIAVETRAGLNASMTYNLWITDMMIKVWEEIHGTGNRS